MVYHLHSEELGGFKLGLLLYVPYRTQSVKVVIYNAIRYRYNLHSAHTNQKYFLRSFSLIYDTAFSLFPSYQKTYKKKTYKKKHIKTIPYKVCKNFNSYQFSVI